MQRRAVPERIGGNHAPDDGVSGTASARNILAIDPGTALGWALLEKERLEWGTETFDVGRHESRGMRWVKFNRWLERIAFPRVDSNLIVAYEQSHQRGGPATEIAMGFVTRVHEFCAANGFEYTSVHTATLKKFATGSGRADKDAMKLAASKMLGVAGLDHNKRPTMEWAKWMDETTEHEADAICLLYWVKAQYGILGDAERP